MLKNFPHTTKWPTQYVARLSFLFLILNLASCGSLEVYKDANRPLFYSNESYVETARNSDSLNVMTFNIKEAEKIELATAELVEVEKTKKIDVYLLQEMDEQGVESIAKSLGLNYLYIPIVNTKRGTKEVGNAILTKNIICQPEKLILPHTKLFSNRPRHVTIGEITVQQKKILVYSVHTETVVLSRKKRMEQVHAIIEHAKTQLACYQYILIGGDFNTLLSGDAKLAIQKFETNGFDWSTAQAGSTASAFFGWIKPTHDYIFSSGLKMVSARKIEESRSSDHFPVVATFTY